MKNANFVKAVENLRKHRDIILVMNDKRRITSKLLQKEMRFRGMASMK